MKRFICFIGLVLLFGGGCTTLAFETAEKKLSQWTDAQCSYAHILVGQPYCVKPEPAKEQPPLYCFRSIGDVDCYAEADPYQINPSGRALQPPPLATPAPKAVTAPKPETPHDDP